MISSSLARPSCSVRIPCIKSRRFVFNVLLLCEQGIHVYESVERGANFHAGRQSAPLMMKETMGVPSRWAEVVKPFDGSDRES